MRYCPQCDSEMEHQEDDPDVGVVGGYYCDKCDKGYPESDFDDEPTLSVRKDSLRVIELSPEAQALISSLLARGPQDRGLGISGLSGWFI